LGIAFAMIVRISATPTMPTTTDCRMTILSQITGTSHDSHRWTCRRCCRRWLFATACERFGTASPQFSS
jgi:hypothetical protein